MAEYREVTTWIRARRHLAPSPRWWNPHTLCGLSVDLEALDPTVDKLPLCLRCQRAAEVRVGEDDLVLRQRDQWQAAIWANESLTTKARIVAHAYGWRAGPKDHAWVTQPELMQMTGLSERSVRAAVRELEAAGWLARIKDAHYQSAPVYRLVYPPDEPSSIRRP